MKVTPAQRRVLLKANRPKGVMILGGFDGDPAEEGIEHPDFDSRIIIERLICMGLLTGGLMANQHVLTDAGRQLLAARKKK